MTRSPARYWLILSPTIRNITARAACGTHCRSRLSVPWRRCYRESNRSAASSQEPRRARIRDPRCRSAVGRHAGQRPHDPAPPRAQRPADPCEPWPLAVEPGRNAFRASRTDQRAISGVRVTPVRPVSLWPDRAGARRDLRRHTRTSTARAYTARRRVVPSHAAGTIRRIRPRGCRWSQDCYCGEGTVRSAVSRSRAQPLVCEVARARDLAALPLVTAPTVHRAGQIPEPAHIPDGKHCTAQDESTQEAGAIALVVRSGSSLALAQRIDSLLQPLHLALPRLRCSPSGLVALAFPLRRPLLLRAPSLQRHGHSAAGQASGHQIALDSR